MLTGKSGGHTQHAGFGDLESVPFSSPLCREGEVPLSQKLSPWGTEHCFLCKLSIYLAMGLWEKVTQFTGPWYMSQGKIYGKGGEAVRMFLASFENQRGEAGRSGYTSLHASFSIHVQNVRTQFVWERGCEISQSKATLG